MWYGVSLHRLPGMNIISTYCSALGSMQALLQDIFHVQTTLVCIANEELTTPLRKTDRGTCRNSECTVKCCNRRISLGTPGI